MTQTNWVLFKWKSDTLRQTNIVSNGFEHPIFFVGHTSSFMGPLQKMDWYFPRTSSRLLKDRPLVIVDQKTLTKTKVKLQLAAIWFFTHFNQIWTRFFHPFTNRNFPPNFWGSNSYLGHPFQGTTFTNNFWSRLKSVKFFVSVGCHWKS